ncbi:hypothetical protein [Zoogloea sp.]|uniref:hypothetical protein n=1 Tax=Zoogloea sp. TaxID=49181 RepID=UPI0035B13CF2
MELDIKNQRRNLIVLSTSLAVFELVGARLNNRLLSDSIIVDRPENLISFTYVALAYVLWRYWLYARESHLSFKSVIEQRITNSPSYKNLIQPFMDDFRDASGADFVEGFEEASKDAPSLGWQSFPPQPKLQAQPFRRVLKITVENPKGNYKIEEKDYRVSLLRYEWIFLRSWLTVAVGDKAYSDLYIPYVPAFMAASLFVRRVFS